ncbi:MAG: transcription elongation factor GreA [Anaerolineae bacterium]|nr:transcription elongation factor GreA [Anaerolineae bacterium]
MTTNANYLTAEGIARLREELADLKGRGRDEIAKRLRAAIEQGDLSENADYISAKEEQAFLEGRIRELELVLNNAIIIDEIEQNLEEVGIGDRVTIKEEGYDIEETYHMVGPKEADPTKGRISYESPIGKALIGHKVGEVVNAETPSGSLKLKIIRIE